MENNEEKSEVRGGAEDIAEKPVHPRPQIEDGSINDVIELSEIAVPRSSADDSIIELTGDVVDSAIEGVFGERGGESGSKDRDAKRMDLFADASGEPGKTESGGDAATNGHLPSMGDTDMATGDKIDAIEEDITKELDNYFQLEEQAIDLLDDTVDKIELHGQPISEPVDVFEDEPISLAHEQFESALENVIEKLYAEKIERILNEVIERVVTDDVEKLREYILMAS